MDIEGRRTPTGTPEAQTGTPEAPTGTRQAPGRTRKAPAGPELPVLAAEGLVKIYAGRRALDGFTLSATAGEIVGLVGPNGAGKTTFAEVVAGLVRPEAGRVRVGGLDTAGRPRAARALMGICPQETALYPAATVAEHLRLFGALAGLRRAALRRAVDDITEQMELTGVTGRPAGLLSGGERKRTQAATALIAERPLLLLDEPTVGADPLTRAKLLAVVADRAKAGAAVVYATHYLPELAELHATVAVAQAGRIVARGTLDELSLERLHRLLTRSPAEENEDDEENRDDAHAA
jgi:ABC-type multidrug transport system ATPase subunit